MSKQLQASPEADTQRVLLSELLSFFFPVHYRLGMDLEKCMCQGRISRKQAAILWLIESEVGAEGWMRRRDIEQRLSGWFEISNSNVSQVLRELARPPLSLVQLIENPASGREKVVALTAAGQAFFETMLKAAIDHLGMALGHLSEDELRQGVGFFAQGFYASTDAAAVKRLMPQISPQAAPVGRRDRSKLR